VPAPTNAASTAVYFVLSGSAQTNDPSAKPPIMRAAEALVGYADIGSCGPVQQLFLTIAWAEDKPGYAKETSAWTNQFLNRQ
jgi:hypothetical protein